MKILLTDIETAPNTAQVWGLWQQNIGLPQIIESGYTLCWAAKWRGEKEVFFDSIKKSSPKAMLRRIHKLLSAADAVVHYNGTKFDIPTLNKEFLMNGMSPPAPYRQIDLLRVVRQQFRFPSNKLDYIVKQLGLGSKTKHIGHELWIKCMAKDAEAWKSMEEYNKNDVLLLEELYEKALPWIKNHPNYGLHTDGDELICTNCGSDKYARRGFGRTTAAVYRRYQCNDCGTWFRGVGVEASAPKRSTVHLT